ncbi:MAG: NlpC/P60 family protein [Actinobacteria bacterium]|nr:NlpC/P60 family protein [Actinomycetota bacterium]
MRRLAVVLFAVFVAAGGVVAVGVTEALAEPGVVENTTEGRFEADEGWGASSYGRGVSGENYRFARPSEDGGGARFNIEIPERANYAVYARWPKVKGLNDSAPVGVETASGTRWTKVNQQKNGGRWVRIGEYEMEAGDAHSVKFSRQTSGDDYVAADAVKVKKVSEAAPARGASKGDGPEATSERASASGQSGEDVVREARKWIGVRYRLGGESRRGVDCSGLTMQVYKKFGVPLQHWDEKQYRKGARVPKGREKPGDLVFFNEHGRNISHVGIYAGNGKIIHASDYYNKVTESQMKYIKGYVGARRVL